MNLFKHMRKIKVEKARRIQKAWKKVKVEYNSITGNIRYIIKK